MMRLRVLALLLCLGLATACWGDNLLLLLNSGGVSCPVPSIAYWKFNESDTTTSAADSVGANTGTLTNMAGTEWEAGHLNNALRFDGTNDYVDAGDIAAVDTAPELSVCAWVFHDVLTSDDAIFSKMDISISNGIFFIRDDVGAVSGRVETYLINIKDSADADSAIIEGAQNASVATTETFVCFTFETNATNGLRLYVNGVEDANSPVNTTGINSIATAEAVKIGGSTVTNRSFDGRIDNVLVHGGIWSAADITALYNGGAGCEST